MLPPLAGEGDPNFPAWWMLALAAKIYPLQRFEQGTPKKIGNLLYDLPERPSSVGHIRDLYVHSCFLESSANSQ